MESGAEQRIEQREETERQERVSGFVRKLLETGVEKLETPTTLKGREFYITCRTIDNTELSKNINDMGNGFTTAYIINLFEKIPPQTGNLIPIGYRDVKTKDYSSSEIKKIKASGNFSVKQNFREGSTDNFDSNFKPALQLADRIRSLNGIEILDLSVPNSSKDIKNIIEYLKSYNLAENTSWRKIGLGKLLIGIELELLKQKKADELDLPSLSDDARYIFAKLLKANGLNERSQFITLSKIEPKTYYDLVTPFITK